ncbi:MAG: VOC family protein [Burkholderiales bacterium]|nr:VOC family protein [Burkholderiales bacterium]
MSTPSVLRTAPEYPESQRPPHIHKISRPDAWCKATSLAFLIFEKKDLSRAARFWSDFGLMPVTHTAESLVMRAAGPTPACLVARKARRSRYVGAAFEVPESTDFAQLKRQSGAKDLNRADIPGGGEGVRLIDPDGHEVWLLRRWARVPELALRPALIEQMNALGHLNRVNRTVRPPIEPARIGRLGHVVMQTTDFARMANWYMQHLGLLPTDVQYLPDGSPLLTFFRLDLGRTPADHHTVVIAEGIENRYEHSAWEVADLDALGQGQQVLRANGHRHMWGIGRHVLGSQLFDYWLDDDGFEFEHYTDGDLFTADHEPHYVPFTPGSIWAWGDDAPDTMFPKKTPVMLWKVLKLLIQKRMTVSRLRMLGSVLDTPARPWS